MRPVSHMGDTRLRGGLAKVADRETPLGYAGRLARYMSDASTVRVRVLEMYGRAPSREHIQRLIDQHRLPPQMSRQWGKPASRAAEQAWEREQAEREAAEAEARAAAEAAAAVLAKLPPAEDDFGAKGVIVRIARAHGLTSAALRGPSRERRLVRLRALAAAVLAARGNSLARTAVLLGRGDHSTSGHAITTFFRRDAADPALAGLFVEMAPPRGKWPLWFENTASANDWHGVLQAMEAANADG